MLQALGADQQQAQQLTADHPRLVGQWDASHSERLLSGLSSIMRHVPGCSDLSSAVALAAVRSNSPLHMRAETLALNGTLLREALALRPEWRAQWGRWVTRWAVRASALLSSAASGLVWRILQPSGQGNAY